MTKQKSANTLQFLKKHSTFKLFLGRMGLNNKQVAVYKHEDGDVLLIAECVGGRALNWKKISEEEYEDLLASFDGFYDTAKMLEHALKYLNAY